MIASDCADKKGTTEDMLDAIIDKLTQSIEEQATGRVLDTEVRRANLTDADCLEAGWLFDWRKEVQRAEVYKLVVGEHGDLIHGLISLSHEPGYVLVNLLESNPRNVGRDKEHVGVPGNLFAFAAKRSFELGNEGFVVFVAKTALIRHYEQTLGARRIGGSQRMFLDTKAAARLVETYFGGK